MILFNTIKQDTIQRSGYTLRGTRRGGLEAETLGASDVRCSEARWSRGPARTNLGPVLGGIGRSSAVLRWSWKFLRSEVLEACSGPERSWRILGLVVLGRLWGELGQSWVLEVQVDPRRPRDIGEAVRRAQEPSRSAPRGLRMHPKNSKRQPWVPKRYLREPKKYPTDLQETIETLLTCT